MCVVASVCMHVTRSRVWAKGPEAHEVARLVPRLNEGKYCHPLFVWVPVNDP